jgi:hypothetical protein
LIFSLFLWLLLWLFWWAVSGCILKKISSCFCSSGFCLWCCLGFHYCRQYLVFKNETAFLDQYGWYLLWPRMEKEKTGSIFRKTCTATAIWSYNNYPMFNDGFRIRLAFLRYFHPFLAFLLVKNSSPISIW